MAGTYELPDQPSRNEALSTSSSAHTTPEEPSIATLLGELVADAQDLVRKEIELAKQEVRDEISKAKDSAISLGIGGVVLAIGGLLLVLMLVHLLSDVFGLRLWLSYLLVGLVFAIVGGVLLMRGRSKASEIDLVPRATVQEVKKDVAWIKDQTPSDKS